MSGWLTLFLYIFQQAGVLVGAGAAMLGMFWYLKDFDRAPVRDSLHAARTTESLGLALIVLSGLGIVMLHWSAGAFDILLAPAFICKWILIVVLIACALPRQRIQNSIALAALEGCSGGNWLVLVLINFMAPVTTWSLLLSLYAGWVIFFALVWTGCLLLLHHERAVRVLPVILKKIFPAPAPKPAPVVVPVAKIITPVVKTAASLASVPEIAPQILPDTFHPKPAAAPAVVHAVAVAPVPAPVHVPAPAPKPMVAAAPAPVPAPKMDFGDASGLPALRVMPRRPEDINNENRGPVVQFT